MAGEADDRQLLESYAADGSQEAFGELVRRHVAMVYGSALRQVRDPHMAEDITQTVFTLLARKAGSIRGRSLAGWLFITTRHAAANELRSALRRQRYEQRAASPQRAISDSDAVDPAMSSLLDDALANLSRADREAVLLHYVHGHDVARVAQELDVSDQAARKRLTRAIHRLRRFFARHGAAITMVSLGAALGSSIKLPPGLTERVTASALGPSAARMAVVRQVISAMRRARLAAAAPLLAAVVIVAGGLVVTSAVRAYGADTISISPPARFARPNLKLTIPWSRQVYTVPVPATFPDELRATVDYREWERSPGPRTFSWSTRDGRRYVAQATVAPGPGGGRIASIGRVRLFREDGTLQIETLYDQRGSPRQWYIYAADGKTRQTLLTLATDSATGAPFVESVRFFNADGGGREYHANREGTVDQEWLLDKQGRRVRLLNSNG